MTETGSTMMLVPLVAPLRAAGVDLTAFWRDVGIAPADLADPRARIENVRILAAWSAAERRSGDENFGLHAALSYEPGMFHVLDHLVAHAATLDEALEEGRSRLRLLHDLASIERRDEGDSCVLRLRSAGGGVLPRAQADFFLACLVLVARMLSGLDAAPDRVCFPHSSPRDGGPARKLFRCELGYRAGQTAVEFPSWYLERPCLKADPSLSRVVREHADLLLEQLPEGNPLLLRVRSRIAEQLRRDASLQTVAQSLAMSPRTLRRRLLALGTNFQELREGLRMEMARRLLADARLSLEEVAEALAFSSAQSFSRAFRRSEGVSPAQFRRSQPEA